MSLSCVKGNTDNLQFWKQFFEASANVSLSGYEEPAEEEVTQTETSESLQTPVRDDDDDIEIDTELRADDDDEEYTIESPTQVTGAQSTPRLPPSTAKKPKSAIRGQAARAASNPRSPSPRKYTGQNPLALDTSSEQPSTPRMNSAINLMQSSPFEPESGYQPSAFQRPQTTDPLMHRILDKTYRIQATPHTERRRPPPAAAAAAAASKPTPATAERKPWDDSPGSSPIIAAPQLRSDLFSPARPSQRTPGVSVLTPAASRRTGLAPPTTSTGRQLFSPADKAYSAARQHNRATNRFSAAADEDDDESQQFTAGYHNEASFDDGFDDDDDTTEDPRLAGMSPPKTLQFHVPQSRLLQTPAREASRRIVDDLLLTAGADATDEIEGDSFEFEVSPSVVRNALGSGDDDTF